MATQAQVKAFIEKIAPIAIAACKARTKKVLPSVCIAQACCESAYGTSEKMKNAKAIFGIKVGKSKVHFGNCWNDKAYSTKTKECYDGKTYEEITDLFRAYDSFDESIGDYYDMLGTCSRYAGCIGVKDSTAAITAIKNGGYATSPTYVKTISSIIKSYNLTQYDSCMTGSNTTEAALGYTTGTYIITASKMNVRTGHGTNFPAKALNQLTAGAQKQGGYIKGVKFTASEIYQTATEAWAKTPSGWVCIQNAAGTYCEKQ